MNIKRMSMTVLISLSVFAIIYVIIHRTFYPQLIVPYNATIIKQTPVLNFAELKMTDKSIFNAHKLRGKWTVLFFGYMGCPDICPKTLKVLSETWQEFEKQDFVPVDFIFISINKHEPDINELQQYLSAFHPKFHGAIGNRENTNKVMEALGVFAKDNGITIDHTSALLLIDPNVRLKAIITPPFTVKDLVHDLNLLTKKL